MADVEPIPADSRGLIPHLVCDGAAAAIDFYVKAFGAVELRRHPMPTDGRLMHAEIRLGETRIYLCDDFPEMNGSKRNPQALGGSPVTLHRYVESVDDAVAQAEAAGATVTMPPQDMFWGDRYGIVTDAWGHVWSFAQVVKVLTPEEMEKAAAEAFGPGGGA
ncbi:MAG: VOC family protein [Acidobacteriota bacterium]